MTGSVLITGVAEKLTPLLAESGLEYHKITAAFSKMQRRTLSQCRRVVVQAEFAVNQMQVDFLILCCAGVRTVSNSGLKNSGIIIFGFKQGNGLFFYQAGNHLSFTLRVVL